MAAPADVAPSPREKRADKPSLGPDPGPTETLEQALRLEALGFSVIPLQPDSKRPARSWKRRQTHRASPGLIREWWRENRAYNLGSVTGRVSGKLALDVDPRHGGRESLAAVCTHLPPTPTVNIPSGGQHIYFRLPSGKTWRSRAGLRPGLDVRCEGGYVVAAGSRREDGEYTWAITPEEEDFALPPTWLLELLEEPLAPSGPRDRPLRELHAGVEKGRRKTTATRLIGAWIAQGLPLAEVQARAVVWAQTCRPPLPAREAVAVVASLARAEARQPPGTRGVRVPRSLLKLGLRDGPLLLAAQHLVFAQEGRRQPPGADNGADSGRGPRDSLAVAASLGQGRRHRSRY